MHLYTRTLVVVAMFVALIPTVICALILYTRQTCPGFGRLALGNLALTLSLVFLCLLAMGLWIGSFSLACGIMLLRAAPAGRRFSMFFTGIVFMVAGAANLIRGVYFYTQAPVTDLLVPSIANAVFFGGTSLCIVSWSFGFILMNGEWLVTDAKEALRLPATIAVE